MNDSYPIATASNAPIALNRFQSFLFKEGLTSEHQIEFGKMCRVELARRAAKRGDILTWGWALFPHKFIKPFCKELHEYFVSSRHEPFLWDEAPRGHAKTTIEGFLIPIYMALEEYKDPKVDHDFFLNVQATESKSRAINLSIRYEFEENDLLSHIYGDQMVKGGKWTDGLFVLNNGVVFAAVSAGQSIRGVHYRNRRPDYINVDDLYDEEDINNPDSTLKKNDWFWGTLFQARSKSKKSCVHIHGTAINKDDLLEQLKKDKRFKGRTFKAIKNWDKKLTLWPEMYTFEGLMNDRKSMSPSIFDREMQNDRRDETVAIVKREWLSDWEYDPGTLRFNASCGLIDVLVTCDPSIGKKEDNDPAGFAVILKVLRAGRDLPEYYIDALVNERLSLQRRIDTIKNWVETYRGRWPITEVRVETIAGFKDFGDLISQQVPVGCVCVDRVPDKITNLEKKSYYFQNRRIFLNKFIDKELKDELVNQLTTNYPRHDDIRDAVLLGLEDSEGGVPLSSYV